MTDENEIPGEFPSDPVDQGFGLNEPTGQFADLDERKKREAEEAAQSESGAFESSTSNLDDLKYKSMGWKGIHENDDFDEEDEDEDVRFNEKEPIPEDELDMTPMVDVTFLLLIFFMVTASFTVQLSQQQPHAKSEDPSPNPIEEQEPEQDFVQVLIDQTNTYYVTTRDEDEVECPSDNEMRAKVRNGFESANAERLVIVAHLDSLHSKVVTAWDAGVVSNANKIEIQTTDEDY